MYWWSIFNSWRLSCQAILQVLARLLAFKWWFFYNFWKNFPFFRNRKILHSVIEVILSFFNICNTKLLIVHFRTTIFMFRYWIWSILDRRRNKNGRLSHDYVINLTILVGETCHEINFINKLFRSLTEFDLDLMMRWLFLNHILVLLITILIYLCILLLLIFNLNWVRATFALFFYLWFIIKRKWLCRSFVVENRLNDHWGTVRFGQLWSGCSCCLKSTASWSNTKQDLGFISDFIFNDTHFLWRLNDRS